jgi:hypothetical protein
VLLLLSSPRSGAPLGGRVALEGALSDCFREGEEGLRRGAHPRHRSSLPSPCRLLAVLGEKNLLVTLGQKETGLWFCPAPMLLPLTASVS